MSGAASTRQDRTPGGVVLGWVLFGGILLWMVHLIGQSALVGRACATGTLWSLHAITLVTFVATLHPTWLGWRIARSTSRAPGPVAAQLLGWIGVFLNVSSLVLIVVEWAPVLVLDPCVGGG